MASRKVDDNSSYSACINSANHLIELCELPSPRIASIQDINSNFLIAVFECITGHTIPNLLVGDDTTTEVHNVQAVIDTLSLDLLGLSLSHISGEDIVSGNTVAIFNLLEVLEGIFLQLFPRKKTHLKERKGFSSSEDSDSLKSKAKFTSSSKSTNSEESSNKKNVLPVLKRKLCKKTVRHGQKYQSDDGKVHESQTEDHSDQHSLKSVRDNETSKSPLKRKSSKPVSGAVKRPHTEGIEQLYDLNFEKEVRALLLSNKLPLLRSHQMKMNYLQTMKTSLKRKSIPACKKSFLLPSNLRSKSTIRKPSMKRKRCQEKKPIEPDVSKKNEKLETSSDPDFVQSVLDEFPGFQFPKNTLSLLTTCYHHHVGLMHKQLKDTLLRKPPKLIQSEKAIENQSRLSKVLEKDIQERIFLGNMKEHQMLQNKIKFSMRDARLQSAKTRQYFDEFHREMSKKLKKRNFSEEVLIEKTFKDILDLQKEKVRQLCKQVKEADEQDAKQHREYLYALKNLYQEQLALLTESLNEEQKNTLEAAKAQKLIAAKMNQEIRKKLQRNVRSLQKDVLEMIEEIHFRELDAQTFISSFRQQDS